MNLHPSGPHLLDTSAVIILAKLREVAASDALVGFATLGEISVGIARAQNPRQEEERMRTALGASRALLPTLLTVRYYGETMAALQRIGKPIPINDVWNAALAVEHAVPLLADDAHFGRVPGLRLIPVSGGG